MDMVALAWVACQPAARQALSLLFFNLVAQFVGYWMPQSSLEDTRPSHAGKGRSLRSAVLLDMHLISKWQPIPYYAQ